MYSSNSKNFPHDCCNIKYYEDEHRIKRANKNGLKLDSKGKLVQAGVVEQGLRSMFNRGDKDLGGNSSVNTVNSTSDISSYSQDSKPHSGIDGNSDNSQHNKSFKSDNDIIPKNPEISNETQHNSGKNMKFKGGGKAGFVGSILTAMGISSFFSSEAEASSIPKVNHEEAIKNAQAQMRLAKPQPKSSGTVLDAKNTETLDNTANTLGLGSLATSAVGFISKTAARVAPGVGMAYGAVDTVNRTNKGDYLGAAMSASVAAVSNIPVIGTAGAFAISMAQVATDSMGLTGGNYVKTPHQGFTKQPAGHNTAVAMAQDKIASNTLASPSSTYATQPSVIPSQPSVAAAYTQSAAPTTSAPQQPSFGGSGYSAPDSSKYITNNVSRKQEQQREQLDALQDISEKLSSDDSFTKGSDIVDKNADLKG